MHIPWRQEHPGSSVPEPLLPKPVLGLPHLRGQRASHAAGHLALLTMLPLWKLLLLSKIPISPSPLPRGLLLLSRNPWTPPLKLQVTFSLAPCTFFLRKLPATVSDALSSMQLTSKSVSWPRLFLKPDVGISNFVLHPFCGSTGNLIISSTPPALTVSSSQGPCIWCRFLKHSGLKHAALQAPALTGLLPAVSLPPSSPVPTPNTAQSRSSLLLASFGW